MCSAQCVLVIALLVGLAYSWDVAITAGDRIEFYTDDGTKTATVHLSSQNLTALAYDEVHNMLLYVDKQSDNDAICGYNMTSVEYKCYIERHGRNIQGLAFDPVTELLFFTDTKERSVNWFSFKPEFKNNVYGNLLIKMDEGIPTDLAVDSCRGYVYWINTNLTTSTIERARLNGSDREVVINAKYKRDPHSLAIGQQTQKIYWIMPETSLRRMVCSADLNGTNRNDLVDYTSDPTHILTFNHPNSFTVSKKFLYAVGWCSSCGPRQVWKFPKPTIRTNNYESLFRVQTESFVGIAANYKIKDQFQGISECGHVLNNYETKESLKIASKCNLGLLHCVYGIKSTLNGQSVCKCTPGYTGVRCEIHICENYCLQGNCSFTEERFPKCSCSAGYSGERCEVNVCHGYCSNNGTCSLNEKSEPVCQCKGDYVGDKCEVSDCLNYCLQGNCSFTEQGLPECRCNAGYYGERCEVNVCNGYCLNNGTCSLNEEDDPVCECVGEYEGGRCDVPVSRNSGDSSLNEDINSTCQCDSSHESSRRDTDKNKTNFTTSSCYLEERERNITLGDLLENWHKRAPSFP